MIEKLQDAENIFKNFATVDIENAPNGEVLDIDTCVKVGGELIHLTLSNWADWIEAVQSLPYKRYYAHNGGGWDWLSLIEYLLSIEKDERFFELIYTGSRIILVKLKLKDRWIELHDSFNLIPSSLDKAGLNLVGQEKIEINVKNNNYLLFKKNNRELYYKYLRQDTELLYKIIEAFSILLYEKIAPIQLGVTIASTSLRLFKNTLKKTIPIPINDEVKSFIASSYTGGRVEVFQYGEHKNISVYDVNSIYPSVMTRIKVPISDKGYWTNDYQKNIVGFYEIDFEQKNTDILPLLMENGKGVYNGQGIYSSYELEHFKKIGGTFSVKKGYCFLDSDFLFSDLIKKLYALRQANKGKPLDTVCKLLMNSLYGKFAEKEEKSKLLVGNYDDVLNYLSDSKNNYGVEIISEKLGLFSVSESAIVPHHHVAISACITSASRVLLYKYLSLACKKDIVYCDTDSIHTKNTDNFKSSNELGGIKLEFSGDGVYAGKKLYALKNKNNEKIKAKGVKINKNNTNSLGCDINYDIIKELAEGKNTFSAFFKTASTFREVLKGKTACRFNQKHRTIRKT